MGDNGGMRRSRAVPAVFLAAWVVSASVAGWSTAWAARRMVTVAPDEMTRHVADRFPRRHCLMAVACVTLSDPVIELFAGDPRVHLRTVARPELVGQPLEPGSLAVAGRLRYRAAEGALYLDDAQVTAARFPDLPAAQQRPVAELASGLLAEALRTTPIHRLDEADGRQALAKLVLRDVTVRDGKLQIVIGDDD